jgi:hypothetical protein
MEVNSGWRFSFAFHTWLASVAVIEIAATLESCQNHTSCGDPSKNETKPTLSLLSLLPYPIPEYSQLSAAVVQPVWSEGPSVYLAGELAVELINELNILDGYNLELLRGDGGCNVISKASVALTDNLFRSNKQVLGIIGPGCSASGLFVSRIICTKKRNISLISLHLGGSPLFSSERKTFPYSFSMLDSTDALANAIIGLMELNSWSSIIVLYDESQIFFTTLLEYLEQRLGADIRIPISSLIFENHIPFDEIRESHKRIILLLVGPNLFSRILCTAFRNGFNYPRYQWMLVTSILDDLVSISTTYEGNPIICTREELLDAAKHSIFLQYHFETLDSEKSTNSGLSHSEFHERYESKIAEYNATTNLSIQPSFWATAYFDAVWAMALAINSSIEELRSVHGLDLAYFRYGQDQVTEIFQEKINKLEFDGVSGMMKFNETTGFVSRGIDIMQLQERRLVPMLYYNSTNHDLRQVNATLLQAIEDNFDNFGEISEVPVWISVLFLTLTFLIVIVLVGLQCVSVMYRKSPSIKASSLKILHLAYVGCYLTTAGIMSESIATYLNSHPMKKCVLEQVSLSLIFCGMTLVFSTICVRTWRLYRIFVHFRNPGMFISDKALFILVCVFLALELPVILAWRLDDPIEPRRDRNSDLNLTRIYCTDKNFGSWFLSLLAYNALLLLLSCYFALRCNKIPQKDFKSNSILILAYLLIIELTTGISIYLLLPPSLDPVLEFCVKNVTFLLYVVSCCVLLFMPPIVPLFKHDPGKQKYRKNTSSSSLKGLISNLT